MSHSHHGFSYPPNLLDTLNVLQQRSPPHAPIRILDAQSFGSVHLRYLTTHAPDNVLFPFLHGLEGSNYAQNLFFSYGVLPGGTLKPAQVPSYRGLIWVVCDQDLDPDHPMPGAQARESDEEDEDEDDDLDDECFSDGSSSYVVDPDHFAMDVDQDLDVHIHQSSDSGFGCPVADDSEHGHSHMHPMAHRTVLVPSIKAPVPAPVPVVSPIQTESCHSHERRDSTASSLSTSTGDDSLRTPTSSALSTPPTSLASSSVAKQPLTSSPPPSSPSPIPSRLSQGSPILTSTFYARDLLQTNSDGEPEFIPPKVPDGISLRNFGIQVPIYATLSDIIVYSPKGLTPNSVALAENFKIAVEKKLAERRARLRSNIEGSEADSGPSTGPEADGLLPYNVFVLSATYEELCEVVPSLIVRTSGSSPRSNTVDFAEREKKEMRELTRASEIISVPPPGTEQDQTRPANAPWDPTIGQVFLGNANDVPLTHESRLSSPSSSAYLCSLHNSGRPSDADLHAPSIPQDEEASLDSNDPFNFSTNDPAQGYGYDICVECHEFAPCPSTVHLRAAEEHFRLLDAAWAERCRRNPAIGDGTPIPPRPPPNANAVIHFPFPSSPPSNATTVNAFLPAIRFLERMLQPPAAQSFQPAEPDREKTSPPSARRWSSASSFLPTSPSTPLSASCPAATSLHNSSSAVSGVPPTRPLKILLYSSDGYTESSVPALCLLMVVRRLSLPEAYLELQVTRRRSFFVYQADLGVLRRVETRLAGERGTGAGTVVSASTGRGSGGKYTSGWGSFSLHSAGSQATSGVNGSGSGSVRNQGQHPYRRPAANSVSSPHAPAGVLPPARMVVPSQGLVRSRPRASTSPWLPSLFSDHQAWFNDPRFDGSFPSRVLPFLYLGNLNHASNAYMLHALGITHVVSVGECALVPPAHVGNAACQPTAGGSHSGPGGGPVHLVGGKVGNEGSLWIEAREGRIKVLDIKGVCDDGIDTLEPQLGPICDWIERARLEGGHVLVHCRVGVSRSATVTIAYVMKHLGLPLVDAYLIVRSRRLSVLIQPNMRLLYNLCGWEVRLAQERAGSDEQRLKEELAGALNWPYLAKEVHSLNEKYLH